MLQVVKLNPLVPNHIIQLRRGERRLQQRDQKPRKWQKRDCLQRIINIMFVCKKHLKISKIKIDNNENFGEKEML